MTRKADLQSKMGRGKTLSLNLKTSDDRYNFGSVQEDGRLYFYGMAVKTGEIGKRQVGVHYLEEMARLIGGSFHDEYNEWNWCVKKSGAYPDIREYLAKSDQWLTLISETFQQIRRQEER